MELEDLHKKAKKLRGEHKKFLDKLKRNPPKKLDDIMEDLHDKTFSEVDCLSCANCCKTTSPIITNLDIKRISKYLKIKPTQFEQEYLRIDEDQDFVYKGAPCPFLGDDNHCMIYDVRPKACAEYPHTNRKRFHQITRITLENAAICPATFKIVESLRDQLSSVKSSRK